jgi:hypothetical protein
MPSHVTRKCKFKRRTECMVAEGTATTKQKNGAPGFTTVFASCMGCLAVAYAMMRRRE